MFGIVGEEGVRFVEMGYEEFLGLGVGDMIGELVWGKFRMWVRVVGIMRRVMEWVVFVNEVEG